MHEYENMSFVARIRGVFPQLARDFFRRRRAVRRITNGSLIATLSLTPAYVSVRLTGGAGFPPPKSARKPFSPVSPAPAMRHSRKPSVRFPHQELRMATN